jgi:monoamine oxidase
MLADAPTLKQFGFNEREIRFLVQHPWPSLRLLFLEPYLAKFKDEHQPFGVGYDHLDDVPVSEIFRKEGASAHALEILGGKNTSSLFELWRAAIMNMRGIPFSSPDTFRLKGGNQELPNAFAKRLGDRVRLSCPILSIRHDADQVTVTFIEFGEEKEISADFLANCIPLPAFKSIPLSPALPHEKQFVVDNVVYDSYCRFVFQAGSRFWEDDKLSINMELGHPDISSIWQVADEVDTHRVALMATGPGGVSAQRALAAFREVYPGKRDTIEVALVKDWTKEQYAYTCERLNFPMGQLDKFWPHVTTPHGRIHFAGAYADNLNRGMEAATRSANRVANEIENA